MSSGPNTPHHGLESALATMTLRVEPGRYALLGFPEPPTDRDLAHLGGSGPCQIVREGGETTLLVEAEAADQALERHPGASIERGLAWIRFEGAMPWDLVGFLALVTGDLAAAGVPLGAVCGFSRDHLFVSEQHLPTALEVLRRRFPEMT